MKLFSSKIFEAIKEGQITLAFRLWDSCRLVPGKSYSIGKLGRIIIKSAEKTPLSAITDNDARLAGFDNVAQLWDELKTQKPGLDINGAACFRIEFHYDGVNRDSNPIRAPRPLPPHMLERLDENIKRLDRRAQGVTYYAILREMSEKPRSRAQTLADSFACSLPEIRRKLFRLSKEHLVRSDRTRRFSLTSRASQLLAHREAKLAEIKKSI